jgi:DNA helicase-2/ATP-dependent DNA helicase PcrA
MSALQEAYQQLNDAQREAVDTIEGPVLVIAGPGTGKTQLLSARVANILQRTDTPAQNILCLTFTESGAANMRQRLTRFIKQDAYSVNISTYHAFGSDLISRYPEYFGDSRLQAAVDDLGRRQIVLDIVEAMSYKNPLKQTRHHIGDLMSTISEVKRALLSSADLRSIADENVRFIGSGSLRITEIFKPFTKMPGSYAKAAPVFEEALAALLPLVPSEPVSASFPSLASLCAGDLQAALQTAATDSKTKPLTAWKNDWLAKNADNDFIISGELENRRITALADVLDAYQAKLAQEGLYDFDDMILRSISALENNLDLRYSLHERYLYILLDEFQDTNAAQLRLVQLLSDNPVNEGRPNILAVGDDDQAIYAFQGAQYSNMLEYYQMFRGTKLINLTENYRSHTDILSTAGAVAGQIGSRLQEHFDGMSKTLIAANPSITRADIERREFKSEIAERAWIAERVRELIDAGTPASDIAVLAPKHKHLEPLVPYLNALGVPVRYEKRENILEARVIRELITMSRLLLAMAVNNHAVADALWPQVLSYDFWDIPTDVIWRLSWRVSDSRSTDDAAEVPKLSWSRALLDSEDVHAQRAVRVILATAGRIATESCETVLDYLIGTTELPARQSHASSDIGEAGDRSTDGAADAATAVISPLREYYTSPAIQAAHPELFYETLSHLTVLRSRLSEFQDRADSALMLTDFIRFIGMYEAAEQPMIDTSPYSQQADAVQLSTVFKAKGLEYQHVFLPGCLDDVWGGSSRGNSNKLTIPANLQPIRHAGATDDERLRILFVAITRARAGLYLTSATHTFSGKGTKRLQYFEEQEQSDGSFADLILPEGRQAVAGDDSDPPASELLALDWRTRHVHGMVDVSLSSLLSERTQNYQLSPTHLVSFIDLEYAGPQQFFFDSILRFPGTPSPDSQFGSAIHETLEWYQHQVSEQGYAPDIGAAISHFEKRIRAKKLTDQRTALEIERGHTALTAFLKSRGNIFGPEDIVEKSFRSEGVFCGDVHMAGRIDRMEIDKADRRITVVDYKTGKSYSNWKNEIRLHKYQLQLYAYKLLIEGSKTYKGFSVPIGRLEFIESDEGGRVDHLELTFDPEELERVKKLLQAVWQHVHELHFPDTSAYAQTMVGMRKFEQDLIDGKI